MYSISFVVKVLIYLIFPHSMLEPNNFNNFDTEYKIIFVILRPISREK